MAPYMLYTCVRKYLTTGKIHVQCSVCILKATSAPTNHGDVCHLLHVSSLRTS